MPPAGSSAPASRSTGSPSARTSTAPSTNSSPPPASAGTARQTSGWPTTPGCSSRATRTAPTWSWKRPAPGPTRGDSPARIPATCTAVTICGTSVSRFSAKAPRTSGRPRRRRRQQDDLAENVALREPPVGVPDPVQRERSLDGQLQLSGRDQPGEFSEHARAGPLRVALGLDPVPCDGLEVDDGVDSGRLDAELEGQFHVFRAERVDERVHLAGACRIRSAIAS